jgi:hypothetical protein
MFSLDHRLWDLDVMLEALASLVATENEPVTFKNFFLGKDLVTKGFAVKSEKGYLPTEKTDDLLHAVKQAIQVEVPQ